MSLRMLIEEFKNFDTALLANTIGYIDPTPPHEYYMGGSIRSVTPSLGPTVGVAFTCEMDSSTPYGAADLDMYMSQLEEMKRCEEPIVWVVKTVGSKPDHECVLGDGMAKELRSCGCVGVVTDGGVRDIGGLLTVPFAAYCRGTTIHHSALRVPITGRPIDIGGIVVNQGNVIHAGPEGVIKLPHACLGVLAAKACSMRNFEYEAHAVLSRSDLSSQEKRLRIREFLEKHGFRRAEGTVGPAVS